MDIVEKSIRKRNIEHSFAEGAVQIRIKALGSIHPERKELGVKRMRMKSESCFDLRYNIAALAIAIIREDVFLPEQAFSVLSGNVYLFTDQDIEDMKQFKNIGLTYKEIGNIYGVSTNKIYGKLRKRQSKKAV